MDTVFYEQKSIRLSCYNKENLTAIPHFHTELEMIVCFSGKSNVFLSGKNFDLEAGEVLLVFPNQVHKYKNVEDGEFLVIVFSGDIIPNMKSWFKSTLPEREKINFNEFEKLKNLFISLRDNYDSRVDNSDSLLIGYLNMAMYYMKPRLNAQPIANISSGNFEKICNYCINNYKNKITLEILSGELHLSTQRISHIFNDNMRISIPKYVNFLRISDACRSLTESSDSVAKISEDVGFESLRSFNRAFYQVMKMTPREFREQKNTDSKPENVFL